jgi:hypothetical protein
LNPTRASCATRYRPGRGYRYTRASDQLLIRVIEKAHRYTDNPVLEQMNRDFAAGFIGSKFRIAKFDLHPRFRCSATSHFLSKDDFINGVINPRAEVPKFDKDGKKGGTKMAPRGAFWFVKYDLLRQWCVEL